MARHAEKKKVRKGRVFVSILLLLLVIAVVLGGIGFFQYQASLKKSGESKSNEKF